MTVEVDQPLTGLRQKLVRKWYMLAIWLSMTIFGWSHDNEDVPQDKVDYSKYLGPDYIKNFKITKSGRASTYVCNHTGILDVLFMI